MATKRFCNMCGEEISIQDHTNFNIKYGYGYDSKHDYGKLNLDLCDKCLDKLTDYLIEKCEINPVTE